jgi:hypothetical protein
LFLSDYLDQGLSAFRAQLYAYHDEKAFLFGQSLSSYIWDKVALKVRQYNAGMNADQLSDKVKQAKGLNAATDAYRKASDGEYVPWQTALSGCNEFGMAQCVKESGD